MNQRTTASGITISPTSTPSSTAASTASARARVDALYATPGGPLLGWLYEQSQRRGHDQQRLARELGVTSSYLRMLARGVRQTSCISHDFACACARYLGVPPVVVKLIAGHLRVTDFGWPQPSGGQWEARAVDLLQAHLAARREDGPDLTRASPELQQAWLVLKDTGLLSDLLNLRELPACVQWLQRAATHHDAAEAKAAAAAKTGLRHGRPVAIPI